VPFLSCSCSRVDRVCVFLFSLFEQISDDDDNDDDDADPVPAPQIRSHDFWPCINLYVHVHGGCGRTG